MTVPKGQNSRLFQPLDIADGKIRLKHRAIFAPLTRNRGNPLKRGESTKEDPNRIWYPNDLMVEYYRQRTTDGGLLISEGIPPSLEVHTPAYPLSFFSLPPPDASLLKVPTIFHHEVDDTANPVFCSRAMGCLVSPDSGCQSKSTVGGGWLRPCTRKGAFSFAKSGTRGVRRYHR